MFSQIPTPRPASPEVWAAIAAALGSILVILRKLTTRTRKLKAEYITRAEFHNELAAMRDRIGGSYLALADKIAANHKELLATIAAQGEAFERRIDQLESSLARVDERTRR